jgi:adenylosuccinate synthase
MLDVDHGTYPFVTSSSVSACGVPAGAGVPPKAVGRVLGVLKSYNTRVGGGPFPSEQDNEVGDRLRERGREYGTTTGRPRRCGWFDAAAARYAAELSGADEIALVLLDVLSGFDTVRVCTGYRRNGLDLAEYDAPAAALEGVECVYEDLPGWSEEITEARGYDELPAAAKAYVERIGELVGRPVGVVSVGPDREQTIPHQTHLDWS